MLADGPAAYWRLGETSGTSVADSSGNSKSGNIVGTVGMGTPGALIGESDTAMTFNGNGYISTIYTQPSVTAYTEELWVKSTSTANYQNLIDDRGPDHSGLSLSMWLGLSGGQQGGTGRITFEMDTNNLDIGVSGVESVIDGNWHHIVGTWSAPAGTPIASSQFALYIDGARAATTVADGNYCSCSVSSPLAGKGGALLGTDPSTTRPVFASLDEVAVYTSVLSPGRIAQHYLDSGEIAPPAGAALTAAENPADGNFCWRCYAIRTVQGSRADPVNTATGGFYETATDLSIPGRGLPIDFTRTYTSVRASSTGPLGNGWTDGYAMSLSTDPSGNATITGPDGSQTTFTLSGGSYGAASRAKATLVRNADGTYTFVQALRTTYTFNAQGQLTQEKDLNGYVTALAYNGSGQLATITDPASRVLTLSYTGSLLTGLNDPLGRTVTYGYNDGAGNLTDVTDVNGGHTHYTYDGNHLLQTITDPRNGLITNHYDASSRVDWQTDALTRKTTFAYSGDPFSTSGGTATTTDPKGNVTVEQYVDGERIAVTRGSGTPQAATWQYRYDAGSLGPTMVVDPNGHTTLYAYDVNGNRTFVTDALGRTTQAIYDSLNDLTSSTDPLGVTTTRSYDAKGNLLSTSTPLVGSSPAVSQTTTYTYGDSTHPGDVTAVTDPDNKQSQMSYDADGDVASTTDPLADKTTMAYNAVGWETSSVSPRGNVAGCNCASQYTTTLDYNDPATGALDGFGDVRVTTDPLGHQTVRSYDGDRNLISVRDGDGNLTQYTYDLANEQTDVVRADGTDLHTDFYPDGSIQDQRDGALDTTSYVYDPLGHLTSVTDPLNRTTSYSTDAVGKLLTKTDPSGSCTSTPKTGCTTNTYDAANQLTGITYSDGTTPNVTGITYDADGQRTAMTDGTGPSSWSWDSLHRMTGYTDGNGASVAFGYNLRSLETAVTYPGNLTVTQGFDDAGRLNSVQDWLSNTTSFGYDADSNLVSETLPAGSGVVDSFTVDTADRLTGISDSRGATSLFAATYSRDANSQVSADSSAPSAQGSYRYTALNQVCYAGSSNTTACSSAPSGAQPFSYDAADNLTLLASTNQAFDAAGELCWTAPTAGTCGSPPVGASRYSYDTRGNRTAAVPFLGGPLAYTYDQANRLTTDANATASTTYVYNGDGLRMSKSPVGGSTTQELWNVSGALPLLLQDGTSSYVYGPGGLPLEQITGSNALWLHHDQLGSTRLLTDPTGTSVATYTYDPYGNLSGTTGNATTPFLYAGQYRDAESSLYYLRARYYDPATAQFLTRDPLVARTREPYGYVSDDPVNSTDPAGLDQNCSVFAFWASDWCAREGASTTTGKIVIAGGVVAAGIATGGLALGWYGAAAGGSAGAEVDGTTIAPTLLEDAAPTVGAAGEGPASAGLQRQICQHLMKLNDYMQNPLDYDNTGRLANAINNGVGDPSSIYEGRIAHLLDEIRAFNSQ